ncbi:ABC transporter permease [Streptomyces sp. NPDC059982]|uniref:ABC transporter permease n=1 Tax=unclassified Streptomyces TaxID=2593676 RepID=UPI003686A46B
MLGQFFSDSWIAFRALYRYFNPIAYLATAILLPSEQMLLYVLLGRYAGGADRVQFLVLGSCIIMAGISGLSAANLMAEERAGGTLALLLASPVSRTRMYLQRAVFFVVDSLFAVAVSLVVAAVVFGLDTSRADLPVFAAAVVACVVSSLATGLFLGALTLMSAELHLVTNGVFQLLLVAAGVLVPVASLPAPLAFVSDFLPFSHGVRAAREAFEGAPVDSVLGGLGLELVVALCYVVLAVAGLRVFERVALRRGTLEATA